ncbi:hypothetical protein CPS_1428 [Colwellia psychrerythraea 34H]|uniref:Uncharacterized protein n=1 Tax=Colwellia psychrerythraea (strain 34H / ATCC BAA-681) TaxID=167879 RepID=Q485U4_COLP3|nr:hypothetical protein CPS_1428 [Colwellia psychrerythraea 34H]
MTKDRPIRRKNGSLTYLAMNIVRDSINSLLIISKVNIFIDNLSKLMNIRISF